MIVGDMLGPHRILDKLGEGGMGQVFRARDTKLNRDVALKILPDSFANDPDRLARFTREAQTLASLNHPHIAAIYGLEEGSAGVGSSGSPVVRALVMELVEGEDLSHRIARGALPPDEALAIALQIAAALEAAHERGVVHRDLKPANIKVSADGAVKVLDFGLAKAVDPAPAEAGAHFSRSPTITSPAMTAVGVILGTAAYMSPEQAKGLPTDKRSDVWCFGCVLYEMLTGVRPFDGDDITDVLGAVVRLEPDWSRVPASVPPAIRTLLQGCLVKDRRQRVGDIAAVLFVLRAPSLGATDGVATAPARAPKRALWRIALPWVTGLVVGVIPAAILSLRPAAESPPRVTRFVVPPPANLPFRAGTTVSAVGISPDGSRVVYRLHEGPILALGNGVLYQRELGQEAATPVPGTEGALDFFFSPDSKWIGFNSGRDNTLKRIAVAAGTAQTICVLDGPLRGASWGADDTIVFATELTRGLRRVPAAGGEIQVLTKAPAEEEHRWPEVLPGGKGVIFTAWNRETADRSRIVALSPSGAVSDLVSPGSHPQLAPTGHLVYASRGTIKAVRFDTSALRVVGDPIPVLDGVAVAATGAANYAMAGDGTLIYATGQAIGSVQRTLVWVDRRGAQQPIKVPPGAYTYARLSPDGTRVALDVRDQQSDIWIWDLARETLQRLTLDPGFNRSPVWTPDGTRLAFTAERDGQPESIFWQKADGSGAPERLSVGATIQGPASFSPDGTRLVFSTPLSPPYDLGILTLGGERRQELLLKAPYDESNGQISPDGRWLTYQSSESGRAEVYLAPFPNVESSKRQVSVAGGTRPLWSRDGRELFYYVDPDAIMAVSVTPGATPALGKPTVRVKGPYTRPVNSGRHYDVSLDGKRLLLLKDLDTPSAQPDRPEIHVVQHWTQELKAKVTTGK